MAVFKKMGVLTTLLTHCHAQNHVSSLHQLTSAAHQSSCTSQWPGLLLLQDWRPETSGRWGIPRISIPRKETERSGGLVASIKTTTDEEALTRSTRTVQQNRSPIGVIFQE